MRRSRTPLLLALLVLLVCLALQYGRGGSTEDTGALPQAVTAESPPSGREAAEVVVLAPPTQHEPESEAGKREIVLEQPLPVRPEAPTAVLVGRVVDEEGAPLSDVQAILSSYGAWSGESDAPQLTARYDKRGYTTRTDPDGRFRIEAPVPTAEVVLVELLPDRFRDRWEIRLGNQSRCEGPPLAAGTRDLDEIRLGRTGAIRGRVTDESGVPLSEVEISTGPRRSITYDRDARTEADGSYLVAHAVIGTYGVEARAQGFLHVFREPVEVQAGRETMGIDFVLRRAPTIQGLAVDELGAPLQGVKLYGYPSSSGAGAGARSGPDGRFVVPLPQDEPYSLSAKLDGHESWGDLHDKSTLYEPGTRELRVLLRKIPKARFLVLDASTSSPVERYGLTILESNGSEAKQHLYTERRPPRPDDHPGGTAEATARPGIDAVLVGAEGYVPSCIDVEHPVAPGAPQTIRLVRSGILIGRVVDGGIPVARASLDLVGGWMSRNAGPDGEVVATFIPSEEQRTRGETDEDGCFRLSVLSREEQRLTVIPHLGAARIVEEIRVEPGAVVDLGDIALFPGATLDGRVLLPPGIEPAGLTVYLGHWKEGVTTITDSNGHFHFEGLAAGERTVMVDGRPGELASGAQAQVHLRPGETSRVTLDARDFSVCKLRLRIDLGTLSPKGAYVSLLGPGGRESLGACDSEGRVSGTPRAAGTASVWVNLPGGRSLEHPGARIELVPGGEVEQSLLFELGALDLRLPAETILPRSGALIVDLQPATSDVPALQLHINIPANPLDELSEATGHGWLLRAVPVGNWTVQAHLMDSEAEPQRVALEGGAFRIEARRTPLGTASITLATGGTTLVELR